MSPTATDCTGASQIVAACEAAWEIHKNNCSGFVREVAEHSGASLAGRADEIVDQIRGHGWRRLTDGIEAKAAADAGELVIAGLKGGEQSVSSEHGHVVVVVSGPLANDRYPCAYWGRLGGVGEKNKSINFAWRKADRDRITYAAYTGR